MPIKAATVARVTLGTGAGLAAAIAVLALVEVLSAWLHPFPEGFNGGHEEICEHVRRYPAWVLGAVIPMWASGLWFAGWVAGRVAGSRGAVRLVGGLVLAALAMNLWMLPYPSWFKLLQLLALCIALAALVKRMPRRGAC